MKALKRLLACVVTGALIQGCNSATPAAAPENANPTVPVAATLATGTVHSGVPCSGNPDVKYALWIPEKKKGTILLLDAHARGKLVAERYAPLADSLGWVLVASESTKNGQLLEAQTPMVDAILADLGNRGLLGHGPLWVGGFSGGARLASAVADQRLEVQGLLCLGAGPMQGVHVRHLACDVLLAAGREDVNYWELAEVSMSLKDAALRNAFAEWEGGHAWPSVAVMTDLWVWLSRAEQVPDRVTFRTDLEAEMRYRDQEMEMRGQLGGELGVKPVAEWKPLLAGLWKRAKEDKDPGMRSLHRRVLEYLSLMCYFQAEAAIERGKDPDREYWTSLYRLVDPENAETQVLRAIFLAQGHRPEEALACLEAAANLGFADAERLETLPALAPLRQATGWQATLNKVKGNPATL